MIPSSATCGCGSTTSTTPVSTVNGTFGCSGAPACITVTNGIITAASNGALSGITGSAGCSGLYVPCITVTNGVVTDLTNRLISVAGGSKNQSTTIFDGTDTYTWTFTESASFTSDSEFTFISDFIPTNGRITLYQADEGFDDVYFDIAYSTDNISFTPVGINLELDGGAGAADTVRTKTGSFIISSGPTFLYWRIGWINSSGSSKSIPMKMLTVNLWS